MWGVSSLFGAYFLFDPIHHPATAKIPLGWVTILMKQPKTLNSFHLNHCLLRF